MIQIFLLTSCCFSPTQPSISTQTITTITHPQTVDLTYRISGTAKNVMATYSNGNGGNIQQVIKNNQSIYFPNIPNGQTLAIVASSNDGSGTLKVDIIIDGTVWKTGSTSGSYGSVSLGGYLYK